MRSLIKQVGGLAVAFLVVGSGSAWASTADIKVPFAFVVHGRTLPAGEYRVSYDGPVVHLRGEGGNKASVFVMTIPASGHDPAGESPALTFKRQENQYRLTDIWQSKVQGEEIAHP